MSEVSEASSGAPAEAAPLETAPAEAAPAAEAAPPAKPSWIGVWALVLSLLGVLGVLPVLGSVLGLTLGRVGIRRSAERPVRGGRGLSLAAFLISLITLVVIAVGCAAYALVVAFAGA